MSDNAQNWKSKVLTNTRAEVRVGPRRGVRGGPWSVQPKNELRQPQDGAVDLDVRSRVAEIHTHLNRNGLIEPDDARITGTTRSLMRRLMGLNVIAPKPAKAVKPSVLRGGLMRNEPRVA